MNKTELQEKLDNHLKWLSNEDEGVCADLSGANLSDANLSDANLRSADLRSADLSGANLRHADLRHVDLRHADLRYVDLRYANLSGANLSDADLSEISVNEYTAGYHLVCPEKGSFIGFKKVEKYIVELEIPEYAQRSSATSRKCRCSVAKVLSITNLDGTDSGLKEIENISYSPLNYIVGKLVYPDDFDENRWDECSNGIHFFITRKEAVDY